MKYLHFDEISDGQEYFYSVFVGKKIKTIKFIKSGKYGLSDNPVVKKVKMNSNDLVMIL